MYPAAEPLNAPYYRGVATKLARLAKEKA
jgi:hypothetical protein